MASSAASPPASRVKRIVDFNEWLRRGPKPKFNMGTRRLNELCGLIDLRYGAVIPDTDAARMALSTLCEHLARLPRNATQLVTNRIAEMAPWMPEAERNTWAQKICRRPQTYKAQRLGRLLELRYSERLYLDITTFRAVDQPPKKEVDRERWHLRHAKEGGVSRAEYLQQFTTSAALTKPWLREGISESTYYRRLRRMRETNLTVGPSAALLNSGDEQPTVTTSLTGSSKPWMALGISKATYYRHRARGTIGGGRGVLKAQRQPTLSHNPLRTLPRCTARAASRLASDLT